MLFGVLPVVVDKGLAPADARHQPKLIAQRNVEARAVGAYGERVVQDGGGVLGVGAAEVDTVVIGNGRAGPAVVPELIHAEVEYVERIGVDAVAASQYRLIIQRVCEAGARQIAPVAAMRRIRGAVLVQVQRPATDLELARGQPDAVGDGGVGGFGCGGDRQRRGRVETRQAAVVALLEATLIFAAEAQVECQLPRQTPIVLYVTGPIRVGQIDRVVGVNRK